MADVPGSAEGGGLDVGLNHVLTFTWAAIPQGSVPACDVEDRGPAGWQREC